MNSSLSQRSTPCPLIEDLMAFVTGELSDDAVAAIAIHLETCDTCESRVRMLEAGDDRLSRELKRPIAPESFRNELQMQRALERAKAANRPSPPPPISAESRWDVDGRLKLPQEIGQYRLSKLLGEGGMGAVYEALHLHLKTHVAVKVMARKSLSKTELVKRFEREAKGLARLDHPHIVRALDAGVLDDVHYFVMEFVTARDLGDWIKDNAALPLAWSCECIRQVALGLAYAHEQGVVHRDIKPSNLLVIGQSLTAAPKMKIADLGLARIVSSESGHAESFSTGTGQIMGTPDYMSPEQAEDTKSADARSDIFSLGCTLFQLLTGRLPYGGGSIQDRIQARLLREAPHVKEFRSDIPGVLDAIVARMLRSDPTARYQSASDVAEAIKPFAKFAESRTGTDYKSARQVGAVPVSRVAPPEPRGVEIPQSPAIALPKTAPYSGGVASQAPRRDLRNQQLSRFYTSLTLKPNDVVECDGCGILVPNRRFSFAFGSHLLMAVQERSADLAAVTFVMIELLGREFVTIPPTPTGYVVFLDQFAALPCASCQKRLCPACLSGGMLRTGCVFCRYANQLAPVNFDLGPLEVVVDKLHAATVLATIPQMGAASDMEFSLMQQIVLGSAKKMQKDAAAGQPITWLGLSLREFCRAVESFSGRPINHPMLQEIRQLCDTCLPKPMAAETLRDFQDTVKQYVSTGL